ncbi:hypothetical protein LEP1GSC178_3807 [Leptospira licerasiae str. MMD4847]|uniref:Uncharacterized protein n=1 Tax=Leptospira licerasiae str. MMD4847 TaxID=1049971 RepID=A0ABP2RDX2_9LEPT|nr:hypothetical protein LEP1GSC178_3807 [Leptospira licerasiae str. MMD4847]
MNFPVLLRKAGAILIRFPNLLNKKFRNSEAFLKNFSCENQ